MANNKVAELATLLCFLDDHFTISTVVLTKFTTLNEIAFTAHKKTLIHI